MGIDAATVVRFHRLLIRRGQGGVYYVTRWGGKSQIATRERGIAAIRALEAGHSVGQVEHSLAQEGKKTSIHPLLQAALSAGLIEAINGSSISNSEFNPLTSARFWFRHSVLSHCRSAIRRFPILMQRWAVFGVTCVADRRPLMRRARTAEANMRGTALHAQNGFRTSYLYHLLWNIADTETVFASPSREARGWLDQHVEWTGLENLERARSLEKGVICAGFHFSASRLVAALLLSRGLDLSLTATPSPNVDLEESIRWHREFCSIELEGVKFRQIANVDLPSVQELLAALARNEVVLTFPDMHTINPNSDEQTRKRCNFFGVVRAGFQPPTITVPVAGCNVKMNEWAGWLAAQSSAPVVPVMLLRVSNGRFLMNFESPIMAPNGTERSDRATFVNTELFRVLDRYICAYPSQWFGWHRFHLQRVAS